MHPASFFRIALGTALLVGFSSLAAQEALPSKKLLAVREYAQKYPLSCEAAAASVALQYLGLSTTEDEILALIPYDKTPKVVDGLGAVTWGDPNQGFVGDYDGVYLKTGYGIYAAPLAKALSGLAPLRWGDHWTLEDLETAVAKNLPVEVWVPTRFERVPVETWKTPAGVVVTWIQHEHAMVFRGYDREKGLIYLMDVHAGKYQTRSVKEFLRGWGYLGNQAVLFGEKD